VRRGWAEISDRESQGGHFLFFSPSPRSLASLSPSCLGVSFPLLILYLTNFEKQTLSENEPSQTTDFVFLSQAPFPLLWRLGTLACICASPEIFGLPMVLAVSCDVLGDRPPHRPASAISVGHVSLKCVGDHVRGWGAEGHVAIGERGRRRLTFFERKGTSLDAVRRVAKLTFSSYPL
jgi:hypothetical protein